jgi:hypothetical protein
MLDNFEGFILKEFKESKTELFKLLQYETFRVIRNDNSKE